MCVSVLFMCVCLAFGRSVSVCVDEFVVFVRVRVRVWCNLGFICGVCMWTCVFICGVYSFGCDFLVRVCCVFFCVCVCVCVGDFVVCMVVCL